MPFSGVTSWSFLGMVWLPFRFGLCGLSVPFADLSSSLPLSSLPLRLVSFSARVRARWRVFANTLWGWLLRLKQCFPGSLSALLIFRVFTGGSLAILVVRYPGIWGLFELRRWIADGRFVLALFVVADCVPSFCVRRGFGKTQKECKSIKCKQWSFMIWSEHVSSMENDDCRTQVAVCHCCST